MPKILSFFLVPYLSSFSMPKPCILRSTSSLFLLSFVPLSLLAHRGRPSIKSHNLSPSLSSAPFRHQQDALLMDMNHASSFYPDNQTGSVEGRKEKGKRGGESKKTADPGTLLLTFFSSTLLSHIAHAQLLLNLSQRVL